MSSSFFDLCPDILLHIFKYFSVNELFDIFIDLIPHLSALINRTYMKLHIDKNATEQFWNEILPQINRNQIISLSHSHSITNLPQFPSVGWINLYLQSLYLFDQLQSLLHLEQLSLKLSETIIQEKTWLSDIVKIPNLKKLKLDLMIEKNPLIPQKDIWTSQLICQSSTIKYLEIKLPMTWPSLISLLDYFPNLQTFQASLYQINSNTHNTLSSKPTISCLNSLHRLDLYGYFYHMSSIITYFCSLISNLKRCHLRAMNVTIDNAFRMQDGLIWKLLFDSCPYLIRVKIHLLMNIEENNYYNVRSMKDLMRTFNNNSLCQKHHFRMEQPSINRGYLTLTGDFDKKKKVDCDSFCS